MMVRHLIAFAALLALVTGFSISDEILIWEICQATGSHPGECGGVYIEGPDTSVAYLVIRTRDLASTPSVTCYISSRHQLDYEGAGIYHVLHTMSAITTETTRVVLLGSDVSPGEGIDEVGDFPMTLATHIYCLVTGGTIVIDGDLITVPVH